MRPYRSALAVALAVGALASQGIVPASRPSTEPASQSVAERNAKVSDLRERAAGAERKGEASAAAELYLELCRLEPSDPEWVLAAGRALGQCGRYNDALDALESKRQRFPDALEITALLARTYQLKAESMLAQGVHDSNVTLHLESASLYAQEVLDKHPAHRDARLILAQSLHSLGEVSKAEEQAKLATERFPDHPGGFILLGRIEFERFVTARDEAQRASKGSTEQADALQKAALARDAARVRFSRAVAIDPLRAFPHVKLGDLEAWQGRVPQALEEYGKALAIDPTAAVSHAWIKQNAKDAREPFYARLVEAYANDASKKPEKGATLLWYHGAALTDNKQWKLARQRFEAAGLANPSFQNSWYWAANAAFWDGDHDSAMKDAILYATANTAGFSDLLKSLTEGERNEGLRVLRFLAGRAFEKGVQAGSRDLNHVIALVEDKPESWNNYAFLCRETGRFQDSLEAYVHALELEPESPQLLNDAAVILQYHLATPENLAKARGWYEKALVNADKVLADAKSSAEQKQRAKQARTDAGANLAKLPR